MDIFLFILIGLAILFLVAASSREGHNLGRINGHAEGWNEGETLRRLRESQEQTRLAKQVLANSKSEQPGPIWPVAEGGPSLTRKAD